MWWQQISGWRGNRRHRKSAKTRIDWSTKFDDVFWFDRIDMQKFRIPNFIMTLRSVRYVTFCAILALVAYHAFGYGSRTFESYCPFGGVESLWGLCTSNQFICALAPSNLSLLIGVVVLALIAKKSFCGWACPVGFIGEVLYRSKRLISRSAPPPKKRRIVLQKSTRWAVVVIFLFLTYASSELVFRGFCPYYAIFSGIGHGTYGLVTVAFLMFLLIATILLPFFFCRFLCPLGAVLDPFSRLGLVKICREESSCSQCGECHTACPQQIPVHERITVRDSDCTNCLECLSSCPQKDTLNLRLSL